MNIQNSPLRMLITLVLSGGYVWAMQVPAEPITNDCEEAHSPEKNHIPEEDILKFRRLFAIAEENGGNGSKESPFEIDGLAEYDPDRLSKTGISKILGGFSIASYLEVMADSWNDPNVRFLLSQQVYFKAKQSPKTRSRPQFTATLSLAEILEKLSNIDQKHFIYNRAPLKTDPEELGQVRLDPRIHFARVMFIEDLSDKTPHSKTLSEPERSHAVVEHTGVFFSNLAHDDRYKNIRFNFKSHPVESMRHLTMRDVAAVSEFSGVLNDTSTPVRSRTQTRLYLPFEGILAWLIRVGTPKETSALSFFKPLDLYQRSRGLLKDRIQVSMEKFTEAEIELSLKRIFEYRVLRAFVNYRSTNTFMFPGHDLAVKKPVGAHRPDRIQTFYSDYLTFLRNVVLNKQGDKPDNGANLVRANEAFILEGNTDARSIIQVPGGELYTPQGFNLLLSENFLTTDIVEEDSVVEWLARDIAEFGMKQKGNYLLESRYRSSNSIRVRKKDGVFALFNTADILSEFLNNTEKYASIETRIFPSLKRLHPVVTELATIRVTEPVDSAYAAILRFLKFASSTRYFNLQFDSETLLAVKPLNAAFEIEKRFPKFTAPIAILGSFTYETIDRENVFNQDSIETNLELLRKVLTAPSTSIEGCHSDFCRYLFLAKWYYNSALSTELRQKLRESHINRAAIDAYFATLSLDHTLDLTDTDFYEEEFSEKFEQTALRAPKGRGFLVRLMHYGSGTERDSNQPYFIHSSLVSQALKTRLIRPSNARKVDANTGTIIDRTRKKSRLKPSLILDPLKFVYGATPKKLQDLNLAEIDSVLAHAIESHPRTPEKIKEIKYTIVKSMTFILADGSEALGEELIDYLVKAEYMQTHNQDLPDEATLKTLNRNTEFNGPRCFIKFIERAYGYIRLGNDQLSSILAAQSLDSALNFFPPAMLPEILALVNQSRRKGQHSTDPASLIPSLDVLLGKQPTTSRPPSAGNEVGDRFFEKFVEFSDQANLTADEINYDELFALMKQKLRFTYKDNHQKVLQEILRLKELTTSGKLSLSDETKTKRFKSTLDKLTDYFTSITQELESLRQLRVELSPHQNEGVVHLKTRTSAILGDATGTGKTITSAVAIAEVKAKRVLVLTRASNQESFARDLMKIGLVDENHVFNFEQLDLDQRNAAFRRLRLMPSDELVVTIMSYEMLTRLEDEQMDAINEALDVLCLDEGHHIENEETVKNQTVHQVKARHRWLLSATIYISDYLNTLSILTMIDPDRFWFMSLEDFKETYFTSTDDLEEFRKLLASYMLTRTIEEVLQTFEDPEISGKSFEQQIEEKKNLIPAVVREEPILVEQNPTQSMAIAQIRGGDFDLFRAARNQARPELDEIGPLESNSASLTAYKWARAVMYRMNHAGIDGDNPLYQAIDQRIAKGLDKQRMKKIVIAVENHDVADDLTRRYEDLGARSFTGRAKDINGIKRQKALDDFNSDPSKKVLIVSAAGSEGLNIYADLLIFAQPPYKYPRLYQMEGRLPRMITKDTVHHARAKIHICYLVPVDSKKSSEEIASLYPAVAEYVRNNGSLAEQHYSRLEGGALLFRLVQLGIVSEKTMEAVISGDIVSNMILTSD